MSDTPETGDDSTGDTGTDAGADTDDGADTGTDDETYEGTDLELGQATIVYDDQGDETITETVDNEQLVYARDHWMVRSGTDEEGNDLMKQIPRSRVYRVERNVQQFEEEAATVRRRVESIARDLGQKLPVDVGERRRDRDRAEPEEPVRVPVESPDENDRR